MLLSDQIDLRETLNKIPKWKLALARHWGRKISVGMETREGWNGHLEFFIFWCDVCEVFRKDYGHSWPERRYVTCLECRKNFYFPKLSAVLSENFQILRFLLKFRFQHGRQAPKGDN